MGLVKPMSSDAGSWSVKMVELRNGSDGWRTNPLYTVPEAAHMAHVSSNTVRNWLYGTERHEPLFRVPPAPMVSFLQLVEIVIAANFRKAENVSFDRVRRAYANAQEIFPDLK